MNPIEAVETYINGNISDFKAWAKRCTKLQLLDAFEHFRACGKQTHEVVAIFRRYLA